MASRSSFSTTAENDQRCCFGSAQRNYGGFCLAGGVYSRLKVRTLIESAVHRESRGAVHSVSHGRNPHENICLCHCIFAAELCVFPIKSHHPVVGALQGTIGDQREAPFSHAALTATNMDSVALEVYRQNNRRRSADCLAVVDVSPGRYSILVRNTG
jgi:hypothetical protein